MINNSRVISLFSLKVNRDINKAANDGIGRESFCLFMMKLLSRLSSQWARWYDILKKSHFIFTFWDKKLYISKWVSECLTLVFTWETFFFFFYLNFELFYIIHFYSLIISPSTQTTERTEIYLLSYYLCLW